MNHRYVSAHPGPTIGQSMAEQVWPLVRGSANHDHAAAAADRAPDDDRATTTRTHDDDGAATAGTPNHDNLMRFESCLDGLSIEVLRRVCAGQLGGHGSLCGKRGAGCGNGSYTQTQAKHCAAVHLCHPSRSLPAGLSVQGTAECRSHPTPNCRIGKNRRSQRGIPTFPRSSSRLCNTTGIAVSKSPSGLTSCTPHDSKSSCQEKYIGTLPGRM